MLEIVKDEFKIHQGDGNVSKTNGTAGVMSDIYDYKVPESTLIEIRPNDVFAAYFKDASAEALATDTYEVVVTDANKIRQTTILNGMYMDVKTFDDRNKVQKVGASIIAKAGQHIIVRFKATTVLVNASCYFKFTCLRHTSL